MCCSLERDISSSPSLALRGGEGSERATGRHPKTAPTLHSPACLPGGPGQPEEGGGCKGLLPPRRPGTPVPHRAGGPGAGPAPGCAETRPGQPLWWEKGAGAVAWGQPWGSPRVEPPPRGGPRWQGADCGEKRRSPGWLRGGVYAALLPPSSVRGGFPCPYPSLFLPQSPPDETLFAAPSALSPAGFAPTRTPTPCPAAGSRLAAAALISCSSRHRAALFCPGCG